MAEPTRGPANEQPAASARPGCAGRPRWGRRILLTLATLVVLAMVSLTAVVVIGYATTRQPNPNADFETATTFVYYKDGKSQLGSIAVQNRQPLTLEEMPETMKQAVVAAENRSFWTDKGISIRGMLRAAWVIARGGTIQGGSTITQQYIKILYLNSDQTLTRKFKELFLAYKINKEQSKEEILEGYLNTIYFGRGAYGVQAASEAFFDKDAKKLTVPEAAVLASVVNNPSAFDPSVSDDNIPRLQERYRYVLTSMAETGAITPAQAAAYGARLPKFPEIETNQRYGGPKGFLLKMVERELAAAGFDSSQVSGGGLKIVTTFDEDAQNAAVESAQDYTQQAADAAGQKARNLHAAIASVDVDSGEVLALYGGPNFVKNSRNWATTPRPTASTFKTYALAAALEDEFSLRSTFNGNTFTPPGDRTPVRNEFSYQYGPAVTLAKATADSINTAFVDLTVQMEDGPKKIMDVAQAAGAPKGAGWDANSRLPLGTAEVSPLAQASAYATFGNDGVHVASHVVREVRDANDKVIYKATPEEERAVSEDVADDVTFALSDVVQQGTGRALQTLNRPVAAKTGTKDVEDDIVSAWFVGYAKQISTAVMYVAGDDGGADLDPYARPGDSTFFGGTYPALTWADYMATATEDQKVVEFDPPAYVNADAAPVYTPPAQTEAPEPEPTEEPTEEPTDEPTEEPTQAPEPPRPPTTVPVPTPEPIPTPTLTPPGTPNRDADPAGNGRPAGTPSGGN
ncbi:MAG: transglycosylase domain-containing protein [Actinomycetes bacterium]